MILAGLLVAQNFRPFPPWWALVPCLAAQALLGQHLHITAIRDEERRYLLATRWLNDHVPAGSVVLSAQLSGAILYYEKDLVIVRPDLLPIDQMPTLKRAARESGRGIYVSLFPFEIEPFFQRFPAAEWEPIGQVPAVSCYCLRSTSP